MSIFINSQSIPITLAIITFISMNSDEQLFNNMTFMLQNSKMKNDCNVLLITRNLQNGVSLVECDC